MHTFDPLCVSSDLPGVNPATLNGMILCYRLMTKWKGLGDCRMDLPGPTTSVGTRIDYSVGPWDYPACATRHLKAWSTRTTQE
jgi:hypothetical protein